MTTVDLRIRQVEAFRAVMQQRSVTRAAESLGVSQPAVSRLLADFEASVGFALFARRQGRLVPTAEAHVLNEEVERAFIGLERVAQAAGQIRERRRGALRIAGTFDLAADFLPRVIALFAREHDGVDVSLLALEPAAVVEHVGAQRCDLGFVVPLIAHPQVRLEALGQWPMRCIVPRGHRLARKRIVTAADCAGEAFVSFLKLSEPRTKIDRIFADSGVTRQMGVEAALAQSIVALVEAGAGIALVDPLSAAGAAARVVVKRFSPVLPETVHVARLAEQSQSMVADAFVRHVVTVLGHLR
ncbi:LysR substrate-binding domain-containing protein [Paraburkholderia dinghuensis]|uniref:LysR family transcriptional regulator n=1 Tax=Paraburkholderia dinghuensis TaxID=2305225 RepID=A0A3N6N351_9BURK|nr:LysR substrate-binding domain-containing protein [Paraburkholderia dinghuensis]RQH08945.1 LysR family transcriptional regulator [Paraburkholderia dinghuensis]